MNNNMPTNRTEDLILDSTYLSWIKELKERIRNSRIRAVVNVNSEMLALYWQLGEDIVVKQLDNVYGSGFYDNISKELKDEFPDMTGFSPRNLKYIKQFYLFYSQIDANRQQAVADLRSIIFSIPWGHQIQLMTKCKSTDEALFYAQRTLENGWSRAVLLNFLDTNLFETKGKALNNFTATLPANHSDLAQESLKDPYIFDFISLTENYKERELEVALVDNITKLLLELGTGFAFLGRQVKLMAANEEIFLDLLFYNVKLHAYIVVELKATTFDAAYIGQLGMYVSAVNQLLKTEIDNPTIGLLICKEKNKVKVQWALDSTSHPIGVSDYKLANVFPKEIESDLPSIQQIEEELLQLDKRTKE